jgi:hypothetical protein
MRNGETERLGSLELHNLDLSPAIVGKRDMGAQPDAEQEDERLYKRTNDFLSPRKSRPNQEHQNNRPGRSISALTLASPNGASFQEKRAGMPHFLKGWLLHPKISAPTDS